MNLGNIRFTAIALVALLCVLLVGPLGVTPILRGSLPVIVSATTVLVCLLFYKTRGRVGALPLPILPFILWIWASALFSVLPLETVKAALVATIVCVTGTLIAKKLSLDEILLGICAAGILAMFLSLLAVLISPQFAITEIGIRGIFAQKNLFGFILALSMTAILWLPVRALLKLALFAFLGFGLYLSESTTSMLAILFALGVSGIVEIFRRLSDRRLSQAGFAAVLVLCGGSTIYIVVTRWDWMAGLLGKSPTLSARTTIWSAVLDKWAAVPWTGYGYWAVWGRDSPVGNAMRASAIRTPTHAHNGYVDALIQTGLIGLALILVAIIATFCLSKMWQSGSGPREGRWIAFALLVMALCNLGETRFYLPSGWLFMTLIASRAVPSELTRFASRKLGKHRHSEDAYAMRHRSR